MIHLKGSARPWASKVEHAALFSCCLCQVEEIFCENRKQLTFPRSFQWVQCHWRCWRANITTFASKKLDCTLQKRNFAFKVCWTCSQWCYSYASPTPHDSRNIKWWIFTLDASMNWHGVFELHCVSRLRKEWKLAKAWKIWKTWNKRWTLKLVCKVYVLWQLLFGSQRR